LVLVLDVLRGRLGVVRSKLFNFRAWNSGKQTAPTATRGYRRAAKIDFAVIARRQKPISNPENLKPWIASLPRNDMCKTQLWR
jgi:hypothetical protein